MPLGFYPIGGAPIGGLGDNPFLDIVKFNCTCAASISAHVVSIGFINTTPAVANDDGYLLTAASSINSISFIGPIRAGASTPDNYTGFIRFPNVPVPEGNVVSDARLLLTASTTIASPTVVSIAADYTKFSNPLTTYNEAIARTLTSTTVPWTIGSLNAGDVITSPDLSPILQQLVNRSDWLDPNAHAVTFFLTRTADVGLKRFFSVDVDALLAPRLLVTWGALAGMAFQKATATCTANPYTVPAINFNAEAVLSNQTVMNYRIPVDMNAEAVFIYNNNNLAEEVDFITTSEMLVELSTIKDVTVNTPSITYGNSISGADPADQPGGVSVTIIQYAGGSYTADGQPGANGGSGGGGGGGGGGGVDGGTGGSGGGSGSVGGTGFMPLGPLPNPLGTDPSTRDDSHDPIFELDELNVSYDGGKILKMKQYGLDSYGLPTYHLEDGVVVAMNLEGHGKETYFRGRIKQVTHIGEQSESVEYTAWGIPNLADEISVLGPYGDGYFVGQFILPTTIELPSGVIADGLIAEPKLLINAVQSFFSIMSNDLGFYGIPTNVDISGLDNTVVVSEEKKVSGGFFSALKDLVSVDPGIKVWFDDSTETWTFVRTIDAPILNLDIQNNYLLAHNWQEDSSERYSAVVLMATGKAEHTSQPFTTFDLEPGWYQELEPFWSDKVNSRTGLAPISKDNNELTDEQKVYREWYLTRPIGGIRQGGKCIISYKVPKSKTYSITKSGQTHIAGIKNTVDGFVWIDVQAEFVTATTSSDPTQQKKFLGIKTVGPVINPAQPYARVRSAIPIVVSGFPKIQGDAKGPKKNQIAVTAYVPIPLPDSFAFRYPETGFAGNAFTRYGIRRDKIINVEGFELTIPNAKALLRLYSDIRMSCSLPIYGDPIRDIVLKMNGRISLSDIHGVTGLENANAVITGFTYNFVENQNTVQISSDLSNFIENLGKTQ